MLIPTTGLVLSLKVYVNCLGNRFSYDSAIAIIKKIVLKMFQLSDFWYVERQGKLRKSVATAMTEQFHQQLNQLALDARKNTLKRKIKDKIYRIIVNSSELKK